MVHTRSASRRRRCHGEAGVELVEFALVFPLLLLVVLGIVDYGLMFQRLEVVTNAAREGARVAAMPGYAQVDIEDRVTSYLPAGGVPTGAGNPAVTVTPTTIPSNGGPWAATTVRVSYDHTHLFIDDLIGWFGGALGPETLVTQAVMRNEVDSP